MEFARHSELAEGRWQTLDFVEQLAHIGSEVDRALRAHVQGRLDRRDYALARALELFDLTAADDRWRGARRRETLRVHEYFCEIFFAKDPEPGAVDFVRKYFLDFAVAARARARR